MDELILKSLRAEASEFEERKLRNWRQAAAENERRYRQLERLWRLAAPSRSDGLERAEPPLGEIIRLAEERRANAQKGDQPRRRFGSRYWAIAAAAMLLAGSWLIQARSVEPPQGALAASEFATGRGETVTVTLTDGSFVRLAPESRLRLRGPVGSREVWLDGRAFFAIASDSAHPFAVRTDVGDALVLGTRFELRAERAALRLVVVEGRVSLSAGGGKVDVRAGEVSHVRDRSAPSVVQIANVSQLLDWPDGLLVFHSTPLEQAAREIGRFYHRRLRIDDSALTRRMVTAWFSNETFDEALTTVCRVANVRCSVRDSVVTMTR